MLVAQLVEYSLPTPEIRSSNPEFYLPTVVKSVKNTVQLNFFFKHFFVGSEVDEVNLKQLFEQLDFEVKEKTQDHFKLIFSIQPYNGNAFANIQSDGCRKPLLV